MNAQSSTLKPEGDTPSRLNQFCPFSLSCQGETSQLSSPAWLWPASAGGIASDDAADLINGQELIGGDAANRLLEPAGPLDFDGCRGILPQPKCRRVVALGTIAGPAVHCIGLLAGDALEPDHAADTVAIALGPRQPDTEPVIAIAAVIPVQISGS